MMDDGLHRALSPFDFSFIVGARFMKLGYPIYALATVMMLEFSGGSRGAEPQRHDTIGGTWTCISATVNGKPLSEATVKLLRLTLTKDRYKTEKGAEVLFDSTYTLDAAKDPKQINILGTEGDLKGKEARGIYSLSDDTLKICYTMPGKPRPAAFESLTGSEAQFIVWKRQAAADSLPTLFHADTGPAKPSWDQKTAKRIEACTADYREVLGGRKPVLAQLDPGKEPTASEQFYQGDGYQVHVTKTLAVIDGVSGFVYGAVFELEPDFAAGDMHSLLCTSFYTVDEMKQPRAVETPFHVGTGDSKPGWNPKAQKRIDACQADFQAVLAGKKPVHAKSGTAQESGFYKGEGYHLDIIEAPVTVEGVAGFLYGPMLDFEPDISDDGKLDSICQVTFYSAEQMKMLLGR
jgi:uncharacterized protein (TIGR03067 family)